MKPLFIEFDCLFSRCISGYTCELKPQNVAVSAAFTSPLDSTLIWSAVYACNRAYECWLIGPKWQRRSQVTGHTATSAAHTAESKAVLAALAHLY